MEETRRYYLICMARDYSGEDTITCLYLSESELIILQNWIFAMNNNLLECEYTTEICISYCDIPFLTMEEARTFYKQNKNEIYWISDTSDLR